MKVTGSLAVFVFGVYCANGDFSIGWGEHTGHGLRGYSGRSGGGGWPPVHVGGWGWETPIATSGGWGDEGSSIGASDNGGHGGWGWGAPKVHDHHQHKKVIHREHIHKHNLHVHNIHRHTLHKHQIHQHNIHKNNLHITKVHEPVIHNYHKTEHKVIPSFEEVKKVIPIHQTVQQVHHKEEKAHPVVLEHQEHGWGVPHGAEESGGGSHAEEGGYEGGYGGGGHGGWERHSDIGFEESSSVPVVAKKGGRQAF